MGRAGACAKFAGMPLSGASARRQGAVSRSVRSGGSRCAERLPGGAQLRCRRFLAAARNKLWWMTPEWGRAGSELPPETQFLLLELGMRGPYAVLLPLIDNSVFRATLRRRAAPARRGLNVSCEGV
jgi:hypothetical protein